MDQIFRIEIPIETVDKTNTASLKNLESALEKVFNAIKEGKSSAQGAFDAIQQSASQTKTALSGVGDAAAKAAEGFDESGEAASQAASEQTQAASKAESSADKLEDSVEGVSDAYDETAQAAAEAGQKSGSAFDKAASSTDKFSQRIEKSQRSLRGMFKEKLQLTLAALDKASPVLKTVATTVKGIAGKAWHVAVRMKDFITAPFRKLYNMITSPITMAISIAGVGLSAGDFVSTFADFKSGMSTVRALTGATDDQFAELTETAERLGATTKFTATEASEGMKYLAMAGWDTNEIIDAMPGLLSLAAAGSTELGTAADIVSDVMTAMGMNATEASHAADVFAKTATSSNTTIEGLGNTLKYAAPIAHSFGMSLEDVSAAAGLMANAGIKGEMAGTALRASLLRMSSPTSEMTKTMKKLGISFTEQGGKMKSMSAIVKMLETSFAGLSESEKLTAAQDLFGTEAASAWLGLISQGSAAYDQMAQSLYDCDNAAQNMADIQLDNLQGDFTLLQSAVDGMKISLMDKLNPYLRQLVQWVTDKIPAITEGLGSMFDRGIEKARELKEFFGGVFSSDEFKNADGFAGKFMVAWDKIIAEPFAQWWDGGGEAKMTKTISGFGRNIGEILHGIISGIFAALKGEEVDADGLNLTGFAKAGAEVAKSFVSSFMGAFDLGDLAAEMPGTLKAGLLGFGAFKLGKGGLDIMKTFREFSSAGKPAADALVTVGDAAAETTGIFGGLKSLISLVPGWGWAVAGAIAAVAVGVTLYNKHIKAQKEELWALGDAVEEAKDNFQSTAQSVNSTVSELDDLNRQRHEIEYKLRVAREGLTDEQITNITARISEIDEQTKELIIKITQGGNITAEQAVEVATQLAQIESDQTYVLASIIAVGNTEKGKEVYDLLEQYKLAEFDESKKAEVQAQIMASCNPEKAEETLGLLKKYNDADLDPLEAAMVAAQIVANCGGNSDAEAVLGLMKKYKAAKLAGQEIDIEAELNAVCSNPAEVALYLPLFKKYAELDSNEAEIKATLDASGVTADEIAMLEQLAGLIAERDKLTLAIEAGNLSPEELAELQGQYEAILQSITDLTGGAMDARNLEGEAIDANISRLEEQLGLEKEIARLRQESALLDLAEKMPEVIKGEGKSRGKEAEIQAQIDEANALPTQANQILADYLALEIERKQVQQSSSQFDYEQYMNKQGGYNDKAAELFKGYQMLFPGVTEESANAAWGQYDTSMRMTGMGMDYIFGEGGFEQALQSFITGNEAQTAGLQQQLAAQQAETAKYTNERMQYYSGMEASQTAEQFKGTQYEGMSLKDIAAHYSEFANNPTMVAAFERSVQALDTLNADLTAKGCLNEGEATTVDQINAIKDASFASTATSAAPTEPGETPSAPVIDVAQAYSTLTTQNTMSNGDTKFTRDLAANTSAYNEAVSAGDAEAVNAALSERTRILQDQQLAIRNGIEGINQLNTQIADKKTEIAEAQATFEAKDYQGTVEAITQLQSAYDNSFVSGGTEGQTAFAGSEEAAASLQAINSQLESLGLEKIESLNQLGDALAAVKAAQSTDQSALTALNTELAGLEESRIDLMVQTANALDSLTWNMNNINSDANLDEALKIDESTAGNVESLQIALGNAAGSATGAATNFTTAGSAADSLRSSVSSAATELEKLVGNYQVSVDYIFNVPQVPSLPSGAVKRNAEGGIYDGAMLSLVAEDGPEAIIPLGNKRRDRGLELWMQAGRMLGVSEFAEGGIAAPYANILASIPEDSEGDGTPPPMNTGGSGNNGGGGGTVVEVSISANPEFRIEGGSSGDIIDQLKTRQKELAELLGSALAEQLEDIVSNMT